MNWREHLNHHPDVLGGKPRIKGTRISVELVLERLGDGWTVEQLLESYPHITLVQIKACQSYATHRTPDSRGDDRPSTIACAIS